MGTKLQPSEFDCYNKALCDEPYFVLLARDPDAPILVELWAHMRHQKEIEAFGDDAKPSKKVMEARQCADHMREFHKTRAWEYKRPEPAKREVDAAGHRHLVNRLREQLTKIHEENIKMALHVRLEAMFTWIDVACPRDLVLDAGKIVAEIIAEKAWADGEEMGRKIKEGRAGRCDELLAANNRLLDDKRKMYEPVTDEETIACIKEAFIIDGLKPPKHPSNQLLRKYRAALTKLVQLRSAKTSYDNRANQDVYTTAAASLREGWETARPGLEAQRPVGVAPELGMSYGESVPSKSGKRVKIDSSAPTDDEIKEAFLAARESYGFSKDPTTFGDRQKAMFGAALRNLLNSRLEKAAAQADDDFED